MKDSDFQDYWQWRINYWDSAQGEEKFDKAKRQRPTKQNSHKSKLGNVAKEPSQKTLQMEQAALRQILRWTNNRFIMKILRRVWVIISQIGEMRMENFTQ